MIHRDIWNIWSQLSVLGAICENIRKWQTKLEGHNPRGFGHLPVGGRMTPRCSDALGCASFHIRLPVSFALTQPCIMHDINANTAIVARVKSLSGFCRATGKPFTGFICNADLLPARVFVELQAQDSCQSGALNCLLHQ